MVVAVMILSMLRGIMSQTCTAGYSDSGTGEFFLPNGVAIDASGIVYVADSGNNAVRMLNGTTWTTIGGSVSGGNCTVGTTGTFGCTFGSSNNGTGEFSFPFGVAVDSLGNVVYVSDYTGTDVRKFNASTSTWSTIGGSTNNLNNPAGVAIDSSGNVYVANTGNGVIRNFTASTSTWTTLTSLPRPFGQPVGVAVDASGNVYVTDAQHNAILKLTGSTWTTIGGSSCSSSGSAAGCFAGYSNSGTGEFTLPNGVATDASGNVYVADTGNSVIRKLTGSTWTTISSTVIFINPSGVAVDASGNVYVADTGNNAIRKLTGSTWTTIGGNCPPPPPPPSPPPPPPAPAPAGAGNNGSTVSFCLIHSPALSSVLISHVIPPSTGGPPEAGALWSSGPAGHFQRPCVHVHW